MVIKVRKSGAGYDHTPAKVEVDKGPLPLWLKGQSLIPDRLPDLRSTSQQNIERFRTTMKKKREARIAAQEEKVVKDLGKLSRRDLFIAGFFLFWGEGVKMRTSMVTLSNADPVMIRFFLEWIYLLGGKKDHVHFTLHLDEDMSIEKESAHWSKALGYPRSLFTKPVIKKIKLAEIPRKAVIGHGICNVRYIDQHLNDYVLLGLKHIRGLYEKA